MSFSTAAWWRDLRRRRVFQVAALYAAGGWILVQVVGEFAPALFLPKWIMTALVAAIIIGFPIAIVLAWLFDIGPDGVERTKPGSVRGVLAIVVSLGLLSAGTVGFVALVMPRAGVENALETDFVPIENSIAVLPFLDLSPNKTYEHFSDGISEVLIHQLAQIDGMHVIARTSSFSFKGQDIDIREVGRKLGVGQVLEGSVQRSSGELRIAAQLIDTRTGAHIWSKLFDRDETEIFDIQDEIALAVASAMPLHLSDANRAKVVRDITTSLDAYDLYLIASNEYAKGDYEKAISIAEEAIVLDPKFSKAHALIGISLMVWSTSGALDQSEAFTRARKKIDLALELDDELVEPHAANVLYAVYIGDLEMGEIEFGRAVELNPNYIWSYIWAGNLYWKMGDYLKARDTFLIAKSIEPMDYYPAFNLSFIYPLLGEYELATSSTREAIELSEYTHGTTLGFTSYAGIATAFGKLDQATAILEVSRQIGATNPWELQQLSYIDTMLGRFEAASEWYSSNDGAHENTPYIAYDYLNFLVDSGQTTALKSFLENTLVTISQNSEHPFHNDFALLAGMAAMYLSDWQTAKSHFSSSFLADDRDIARLIPLAYVYQLEGNQEDFDNSLDQAISRYEKWASGGAAYDEFFYLGAELEILKGNHDNAIRLLRRAYDVGFRRVKYLENWPVYQPLHNDSRFQNLVREIEYDLQKMRERVDDAHESGEWDSLIPDEIGLPDA